MKEIEKIIDDDFIEDDFNLFELDSYRCSARMTYENHYKNGIKTLNHW
jgi:hypothetical protein